MDSKAGIVKVAVDKGGIFASDVYTKLFHAAVQAAAETGAAILAHFEPDPDVFELLKMMEQKGMESQRLLACHLDRTIYDFAYHAEVAQAGVFLEYDTIHRLNYHDDVKEIDLIRDMLEAGYEDKLLLSMDTTAARLKSYGSDFGMDFILTEFGDMLEERGIPRDILNKIMVDNAKAAIAMPAGKS